MSEDELKKALAAAMPEHQAWCHGEAHAECCGAGDCDCGVTDALERLLPVVDAIAVERAAEELRAAADDAERLRHRFAIVRDLRDRAAALTTADVCFRACKPCEGCGQHIPKGRTPPLCSMCAPVGQEVIAHVDHLADRERHARQRAAEELLWAATEVECRIDLDMLKRRADALTREGAQ